MDTIAAAVPKDAAKIHAIFDKYDRDGSGNLSIGEVRAVMHDLGRDNESDLALMFVEMNGSARLGQTFVTRDEFTRWWIRKFKGQPGHRLNRLLVRDSLGRPRPSSYKLPPEDFSFGVKVVKDKHDAGATLHGWNSKVGPSPHDVLASKRAKIPRGKATGVFGQPLARDNTDTGKVMAHQYGGKESRDDPEYPLHSALTKPKALSGALAGGVRGTRAQTLRTQVTHEAIAAVEAPPSDWKIKRYDGIGARLDTSAARKPDAFKEMLRRRRAADRRRAEQTALFSKAGPKAVRRAAEAHAREKLDGARRLERDAARARTDDMAARSGYVPGSQEAKEEEEEMERMERMEKEAVAAARETGVAEADERRVE